MAPLFSALFTVPIAEVGVQSLTEHRISSQCACPAHGEASRLFIESKTAQTSYLWQRDLDH